MTDEQQVKSTIEQVYQDFDKKIDIFVANAGVPWTKGPLVEAEENGTAAAEWDKVVQTDFQGVYYCSKYIGAIFKRQGKGSLVITASMSGHTVNVPQLQACYNAVKAGVIHMARSLAVEWAGYARVNSVSPGYIATPISKFVDENLKKQWHQLTPLGREASFATRTSWCLSLSGIRCIYLYHWYRYYCRWRLLCPLKLIKFSMK